MFDWLLNTRRTKKQAIELLFAAIDQLKASHELTRRWAALYDRQAAELAAERANSARLRAALSAPQELQPLILAGCTPGEAEQVAKQAPRDA